MPRPMKGRRVCKMPSVNKFGPLNVPKNPDEAIIMTVDEYETIRLIDLEGYKQEDCAKQMNVARTTVQGIYIEARKKIADSIVNGKILLIQGGEYKLCEEVHHNGEGACHGFRRQNCHRKKQDTSL